MKLLLKSFNTPGNEIAPGSHIVGKNLKNRNRFHHPSSFSFFPLAHASPRHSATPHQRLSGIQSRKGLILTYIPLSFYQVFFFKIRRHGFPEGHGTCKPFADIKVSAFQRRRNRSWCQQVQRPLSSRYPRCGNRELRPLLPDILLVCAQILSQINTQMIFQRRHNSCPYFSRVLGRVRKDE
jgi:hypothetical protein